MCFFRKNVRPYNSTLGTFVIRDYLGNDIIINYSRIIIDSYNIVTF